MLLVALNLHQYSKLYIAPNVPCFWKVTFLIILGMDFLDNNYVILDFSEKIFILSNSKLSFFYYIWYWYCKGFNTFYNLIKLHYKYTCSLVKSSTQYMYACLLETLNSLYHVTMARVLLKVRKGKEVCQLINHTNIRIHVHPKQIVFKLFPVNVNLIEPLEDSTNGKCETRATSSKTNKEKAKVHLKMLI